MLRLSLLAATFACFVGGAQVASAATVEYALDSQGASFFDSTSTFEGGGNIALMKANIVDATPSDWFGNGETGFIFGSFGGEQYLTINLGQSRVLDTVGALFGINPEDRWAQGPFHVQTSTDGTNFFDAGSSVVLTTPGPVMLSIASTSAQYVRYFFGQNGTDNNAPSGLRASRVYAQVTITPIPPALLLFASALGGIGFLGYRRKKLQAAA